MELGNLGGNDFSKNMAWTLSYGSLHFKNDDLATGDHSQRKSRVEDGLGSSE